MKKPVRKDRFFLYGQFDTLLFDIPQIPVFAGICIS